MFEKVYLPTAPVGKLAGRVNKMVLASELGSIVKPASPSDEFRLAFAASKPLGGVQETSIRGLLLQNSIDTEPTGTPRFVIVKPISCCETDEATGVEILS